MAEIAIKRQRKTGHDLKNTISVVQVVTISIHHQPVKVKKSEDQIGILFRIDTSFKRSGTENEAGTGLGLVMCKEYLDIMGGTITVASKEKTGSTFCVSLPMNE